MTVTNSSKRRLIVFVPDRTGQMTALRPLVTFLRNQAELKDAVFVDDIEFKMRPWSNRDLYKVASDINARINERYLDDPNSISGITLCGYSLGVLLLRRAYLDACGYNKTGAVTPWAPHVDRIVLIAAICRGFNPKRFKWYERIGMTALQLVGLGRAIRSAFEGQELVTNTRLDWVDRMHYKRDLPKPMVVNFLGDQDSLVKPDDAIDVLQDPDVRPIPLPGEDHDSIVNPTTAPNSYRLGFLGEPPRTRQPVEVPKYKRTQSIYILLHGMRSSQGFMEELQQALLSKYPQSDVRKPDYGYIPLGLFLSRSHRRRTAARLADDYTQARALNPHANIHFIGHSNGTAILGYALRQHPRMTFDRVYLGGSVLPTDFDWRSVTCPPRCQVNLVRSDRGSKDWAVGILARALESSSRVIWSFEGLGSAGYDGFSATDVSTTWMNQITFDGGHSSMFTAKRLESIVHFLTADTPSEPGTSAKSPSWFLALHKQADWLVPAAAIALITVIVSSLLPTVIPVPYVAALGGPYLGLGIGAATLYALFRL